MCPVVGACCRDPGRPCLPALPTPACRRLWHQHLWCLGIGVGVSGARESLVPGSRSRLFRLALPQPFCCGQVALRRGGWVSACWTALVCWRGFKPAALGQLADRPALGWPAGGALGGQLFWPAASVHGLIVGRLRVAPPGPACWQCLWLPYCPWLCLGLPLPYALRCWLSHFAAAAG